MSASTSSSNSSIPETSFADLGVPEDLVTALDRGGIKSPFAIQAATIPDALAGRDVLGRAPTGSGKTLAFGLPMVAKLKSAKPRRPTGLILSPTRELAEQIRRDLEPLARARGLTVLSVYGGVGFANQLKGLRNGDDLIVATPGRLIDLIQQREIFLDQVSSVVVDEADRMADMGFLPVVKQILDLTNDKRQTVMFSATLGKEVKVLTDRYQHDPVTHTVGSAEPDLSQVNHRFIKTDTTSKVAVAAHLVLHAGPTIVFCRTRHGSDRLARQLSNAGLKTAVIHGNRSQNQRDAALRSFTQGKADALVATDVAARGIHVDGVACVIHFDPPAERADYVHRSGRTARAGASGEVVSLINAGQQSDAKRLQKQLNLQPSFEETPEIDYAAFQEESRKRSLRHTGKGKSSGKGKGVSKARPAKPKTGGGSKDSRRSERDSQAPRSSSASSSKPYLKAPARSSSKPSTSSSETRTSSTRDEHATAPDRARRSSSGFKKGKPKPPRRTSDEGDRSDRPRSKSSSSRSAPTSDQPGRTSKPASQKRKPVERTADKPVSRAKSAKAAKTGKVASGKEKQPKTTKRSGKPRPKKKKTASKAKKTK